jgi:hypothetical protein
MRILTSRAIELFALIMDRAQNGGQAMHNNLNSASLVIALTAGGVYHFAVLTAIAAVLA